MDLNLTTFTLIAVLGVSLTVPAMVRDEFTYAEGPEDLRQEDGRNRKNLELDNVGVPNLLVATCINLAAHC